jgi:hypothetical protein
VGLGVRRVEDASFPLCGLQGAAVANMVTLEQIADFFKSFE